MYRPQQAYEIPRETNQYTYHSNNLQGAKDISDLQIELVLLAANQVGPRHSQNSKCNEIDGKSMMSLKVKAKIELRMWHRNRAKEIGGKRNQDQ